ncbi:hypothetical protein JCM19233_3178 [Vibrio astriarenae]|nr:hypothetical protein JCM19233_3178 [Vibrio sp. C7]
MASDCAELIGESSNYHHLLADWREYVHCDLVALSDSGYDEEKIIVFRNLTPIVTEDKNT